MACPSIESVHTPSRLFLLVGFYLNAEQIRQRTKLAATSFRFILMTTADPVFVPSSYEEKNSALNALLSFFDCINKHRENIQNSSAWIYWKYVVESYFAHDATFQLSLLSSKSGHVKHFTLPIQLAPRFFQACIDVSTILSNITQMTFSAPDPNTSNINWIIACNGTVISELEGKIMLDYISLHDHEGVLRSKFKKFHFITHKTSLPLSSDVIDQLLPNAVCEYEIVESSIENIWPSDLFNEYGMTKKAMRTLEMYDIWLEIGSVIDMSVSNCSSPVECIKYVVQEFQPNFSAS